MHTARRHFSRAFRKSSLSAPGALRAYLSNIIFSSFFFRQSFQTRRDKIRIYPPYERTFDVSGKQLTKFKKIAWDTLAAADAAAPVEYILRFLLAFLLARVRIFSDFAPFGLAFAGVCPSGIAGAVTAAGVLLGYVTGGNILWSLKYISAVILIRAALHVFKGTAVFDKNWFAPAAVFLAAGCVGFVYAADSGWAVSPTVMFVTETILSACFSFFYSAALSPWADGSGWRSRLCHTVSSVALLVTLLMSMSPWMLFGVLSVGRTVAVIILMLAVFRGGSGAGCAFAASIGAAMDLTSGGMPVFTMIYTLSALVSGIFSKKGRLPFILPFIIVNSTVTIWLWQFSENLYALYDAFAAGVIFLLLPDPLIAKVSALFPAEGGGYGFLRAREYARDKVALVSDAFRGIFEALKVSAADADTCENPAVIFDRASDCVCRSCRESCRCWQTEYADTYDILNNITPKLLRDGMISADELPGRFTEKCGKITELTAAINSETRTFLTRRQFKARLSETHAAAMSQYGDIASILKSLSDDLGGQITVEAPLERKLIKYLRGLSMDASAAVFRIRGGRLRAEIRSSALHILLKDPEYLDKLSAVLGTRLCTSEVRSEADRLVLLEAEPLSVTIGVASAKKSGQNVSGDKSVYFRTDEGFLYVILSDGMGTGPEAAGISGVTVSVLERFLKAGIPPEQAIKILSELMLLKNDSGIESATVDLLAIDMFSGESRIFKCGAAPSYVKKNASVRKVSGSTFPSGLIRSGGERGVCTKLRLPPGAFAVMLSDGVTQNGDDQWLRTLLTEHKDDASQELSRLILETASEKFGRTDDMTVLAVHTAERA